MAKEISALELRKRFGEIVEEIRYRKVPYIVTRNGRPMIALVDIEDYQIAEEQRREEAFIEEYSEERIAEFLKEDKVSRQTSERIRKLLNR